MPDLREALATSHHAGLAWNPDYEKHIDRVAACGFASALGVALWKARYMNEGRAYREALMRLTRVLAGRYKSESHGTRARLATQAVREYIADKCPVCRGVGELVLRKLRVQCKACSGVAVRRYSDRERAGLMGISIEQAKRLAGALKWTAERIESEDRGVNAVLVYQLERGLTLIRASL